MDKASKFDDQESLTVPANQVLAIIMDLSEAVKLVPLLLNPIHCFAAI